ncbi:MAG: pilus assembly protein HicB [Prevotella sp.]|nr:pilus assembly protein HicB [Prevotella sp.]
MKVTVQVEKQPGEKNFTCVVLEDTPGFLLTGYGASAKEAIEDMYVVEQEMREIAEERGEEMPELEFTFKFDIGSFFNYYSCVNISGIAKRAGLNASLMRKYAAGITSPKEKRKKQLEECLHDLGKELNAAVIG